MAKSFVATKRCHICFTEIEISGKNIFASETNHSKTLICDVLEKFLGRDLDKQTEDFLACLTCVDKINEYDQAVCTVERISKEISKLMEETENKRSSLIEEQENDQMEAKEGFEVYTIILVGDNKNFKEVFPEAEEESQDFDIENILENEMSEEQSEKIDVCDQEVYKIEPKEEPSESELNRHDYLSMFPSKRQDYSCRICQNKFASLSKLREHRKEHKADERFMCDICGMSYKTKSALNIHVGLHNGVSPFECDICKKKFTQKGALTRHRPIHTGERPYQCDKCGKQFIHYSSFHMHKMAHDGIRDKKCEVCGVQLRSSSHLNRHMLVHTGEKPHACPACGQRFAQRYNMMSHLRSHQGIHRKRKHLCLFCKKSFAKEDLLAQHLSESSCANVSLENEDKLEMFEVKLEDTSDS